MKLNILVPFLLTHLVACVAVYGNAADSVNGDFDEITANDDVNYPLNLVARDVLETATRCTAVRDCHDREICERGRCLTPPMAAMLAARNDEPRRCNNINLWCPPHQFCYRSVCVSLAKLAARADEAELQEEVAINKCNTKNDCGAHWKCINNHCVAPLAPRNKNIDPCYSHADCGLGWICGKDNHCHH